MYKVDNLKIKRLSCIFSLFFLTGIFLPVYFCFDQRGFSLQETHAADTIWTGAVSTGWAVPGNWSLNAVPTSVDNVTIPDAVTTSNDPSISAGAVAANVTINANGILNGNANSIDVYGNWTNNGIFNHEDGTVVFRGSSAKTFAAGSSQYYNVEIRKGDTWDMTISGTAILVGNLIHTEGNLKGGQIDVAGNYIIGATSDGGPSNSAATVINLNGVGEQQIIYSSGGVGAQVRVDKTSGTLAVADDIVVCGWIYIQGTVTGLDTHKLIFGDNYNGNFTPGPFVYTNVELNKTGYDTLTVSGTGNISGNIIHTRGEFQGGQLNLSGDYIVGPLAKGGSVYGNSTVINFNHSSNNQTIVYSAGGVGAQVRIDKTGGIFAVNDNLSFAAGLMRRAQ